MKFKTSQRQDVSHLYLETGRLRPERIIAFVSQNRLPAGLVWALLRLARALVRRNQNGDKGHTLGTWFNHLGD